jgi:murein DD-endopeptidase MepM/ murein hydrolase activator NlpD
MEHTVNNRQLLSCLALILALFPFPGPAVAASPTSDANNDLRILIAPRNALIAQEVRVPGLNFDSLSSYYDMVVQTVFVINQGAEPLTLAGGSLELLREGSVMQSVQLSVAEFARAQKTADMMKQMNFPAALEVQFSALSTLPEGVEISPSLELASNTAALADDYYLIARGLPDELRVRVSATNATGETLRSQASFPVSDYHPANDYIFPLEAGNWYILAFPGLRGHHRWSAATEHGFDITMVDERGSWASGPVDAWRSGQVPRWEDWYAYGKKVLAAADGVVVEVVDDNPFPLDFWNRRDGETDQEYRARIGQRQMELFMAPGANPAAVAGGNYILLEHEGGEFTHYAHLAYGQVRVKKGQHVKQGEHIAGLGGTGEVPAVHLHFQVTDSPDMLNARTLPVQFSNIHVNEQFSANFEPKMVFQPGVFVTNR